MSNLEMLDLTLTVDLTRALIDGIELRRNILDHLPRVTRFTFNIRSCLNKLPHPCMPSAEDVQKSFVTFPNNQVVSFVDYERCVGSAYCLVYTTPYRLTFYDVLSNRFLGGAFPSVRRIFLNDRMAFEHEFFARLILSFPLV